MHGIRRLTLECRRGRWANGGLQVIRSMLDSECNIGLLDSGEDKEYQLVVGEIPGGGSADNNHRMHKKYIRSHNKDTVRY